MGSAIGEKLPDQAVLCFFGEMGAGKTTFIKGLAAGVTRCSPEIVNSPTYVYLNVYSGKRTLYHFDLYRLKGSQEFLDMGFDDYFQADGVCALEWSERIKEFLTPHFFRFSLSHG